MLNTFQVFDVRTDLESGTTSILPLLSGDFIQLPNQPEY